MPKLNFASAALPLTVAGALTFFYAMVYVYTLKVSREKGGCQCSGGWKRKFVQIYSLVACCILLPMALVSLLGIRNVATIIVGLLWMIASILFIVITFLYIAEVRKRHCQCAEKTMLTALEFVNYVQIAMLVIVALMFVLVRK